MGGFFQLFILIGMLLTYCVSYTKSALIVSTFCCMVPVIFGILMIFIPKISLYYIIKNEEYAARKVTIFFRGKDFDIKPEINDFKVL